jgi:hypothetical protein
MYVYFGDFMSRKLNIEFIREQFEKENCELLSEIYEGNRQKLEYVCKNGHKHLSTWSNWNRLKSKCPLESWDNLASRRKLSFDFVKKSFEEEGFRLLSTEYVNAHNKLKYECSNGHELTITWAEWNSGHGHECRICKEKNKTKEMLEFISNAFEKEGYKLLTTKYINSRQKLDYICPKGNKHTTTWNMWQQGKRCPCCNSRSKKTIEFVVDEFAKEGYIVKSEFYENNKQKIMCVCPNGHEYSITRANWMTGYRCPKCNLVGTSKQEIELIEFIKSFGIDVIEHDRSLISPYELDIIIPAKKVAIEYCGLYWHSELAGKDRNYHLYKLKACKEKGYRLITIFEDELLYRKEVVFSRLKNIFRVGDLNVIYARNCVIDLISTKQARIFCEENHLQGYSGSNVKIGAFFNDDLVSVITFSRPSIAKGSYSGNNDSWELNRFCSKINYHVVGIASKLLKYFERDYEWSKIFSYADRRWSVGDLYTKIGFDFVGIMRPNYWYIRNQKRIHRFALRKTYDDPKDKTEWEIRKSQGYNRIWDCGNLKYSKIYSN